MGESGTVHLQMVLTYEHAKMKSTMVNKHPRLWLEPKRGGAKATKYVSKKEGQIAHFEIGVPVEQGRRKDLEEIAEDIKENNLSIEEIADKYPGHYIRYHKGLKEVVSLRYKPRIKPADRIEWRWGPSGSGKTRKYVMKYPNDHFIKNETKWFDGYKQQTCLILDDFEITHDMNFRTLLRILDGYAEIREVKGGTIHINSNIIIITCTRHPSKMFSHKIKEGDEASEWDQIERRLTHIIKCKKKKGEENRKPIEASDSDS